jgi:23S rRNA (pseudouridine1915-N3)-methyltransferase
MHIEIWSIGKANESFIEEGLHYYFQKIKPYQSISLEIIPPLKKTPTTTAAIKKEEEALILKKLKPHHYLILLDENEKQLSSPQWAQQFQQLMNESVKTLVILIGGAYGVSETIKKQAKQTWSLSKLVFPHQLVRLIVAEQVYRSFSILNNSPYHHS